MSAPYGLIIILSNNEKLQSTESFCLRILTIYSNDWSTFWHVYFCHVFFCEIAKYVQAKNNILPFLTDWSTWIGILLKWASTFNELARDGECRLAGFHAIKNFLENKIFHFSGLAHRTSSLFTWAARSI